MDQDLADFLTAMPGAADPFALFDRFVAARGVLGSLYGFVSQFSDVDRLGFTGSSHIRHAYPREWEAAIGAAKLLDNEASVNSILEGERLVEWHPEGVEAMIRDAPPPMRRQIRIEQDLGMVYGASLRVSTRPMGLAFAGLWFQTQKSPAHFAREWAEHGAALSMAVQMLDEVVRIQRPNALFQLPPRQIECLHWLMQGLSTKQIADRLGITVKVVEFHLKAARDRLKTAHRDQTLARALAFGLITP